MRRLVRLLAIVLLVTLAVDLGDWPYIDEILSGLQAQGNATDQPAPGDGQDDSPSRNPGAPAKSAQTYQVLLHMGQLAAADGFAVAVAPGQAQAPPRLAAAIYDSFVSARLDRPPDHLDA